MARKILVLSGKGGVGKSTVCACVAKALANTGSRVLCIDADIGFRSLDLILQVGSQGVYNWLDVISGGCDPSGALVGEEGAVKLLAAPSDYSEKITDYSFGELIARYDGDFDYIFIDAPAGSGQLHSVLAKNADTALLVVTPDPVCVRSADVALDRAIEANGELESVMVVNRFNKLEVMAGRQLKLDDVIDGTHTQLIGVIPESDSVRLITSGETLTKYAASAFERTARRLAGENVKFRLKDFY